MSPDSTGRAERPPATQRTSSLWSLPAFRRALVFAALLGGACSALPMLRVLGPESALASALLLSPVASVAGARLALRSRRKTNGVLVAEALTLGLSLAAVSMGAVALGTLWGERCDPWAGLTFAALGPCMSLPLAALCGVCVGGSGLRGKLATALALLLPLAEVARTLTQFVKTPGIFAFGHFYGYFAGTLYDRHAQIPDAWLRHRALSVALALGVACVTLALRVPRENRFRLERAAYAPLASGLALASALIAGTVCAEGVRYGFASQADFIEHTLGSVIRTARCRAVLPRELDVHQAMRLAEDCELRITQVEQRLGVKERGPVTAYFFRSVDEKRALMGAYRVYIAKPWRREVYVQLAGFPHPVLGHELAHIVARNASTGVFGVPGRFAGLIPEPTLVEGTAVALDPGNFDELSPHEWASAAQALRKAPPLAELLGPRFLAQNQALAYTLAGSVLSFVRETQGAEAMRRIYRAGSYTVSSAGSLDQLERDWRAFLAARPPTPEALRLAEQRFERPGVLSQICPHDAEAAESDLGAALQAGDLTQVVDRARRVLAIDRTNHGARIALLGALAQDGARSAAQNELATLSDTLRAPSSTLARARATLADAELMHGDPASAAETYRALLALPDGEAEMRQREVRLMTALAEPEERALLADILVARPGQNNDPRVAMYMIERLAELRTDGLAPYLAARQLAQADRHDLAYTLTRQALARGLPSARLRAEALRMHITSAFVIGELDEVEASAEALAEIPHTGALAREAADYLARLQLRRAELR